MKFDFSRDTLAKKCLDQLSKKCPCKSKKIKKSSSIKPSNGKPLPYPDSTIISSNKPVYKTFHIRYNGQLSILAKFLLNNFKNKYIYYAIDDILYMLKFNPIEKKNLLMVLYSPIIYLQNNFAINFFDIWIHQVYIKDKTQNNKFLKSNTKPFSYIRIEFFYLVPKPVKKQKTIW